MSKTAQQDVNQDDVYDTEISDDDYGFILGPDGELKSVFLPESLPFKTPKNIARILKVFGIADISNVYNDQTLH
jgi:hypothetical protein